MYVLVVFLLCVNFQRHCGIYCQVEPSHPDQGPQEAAFSTPDTTMRLSTLYSIIQSQVGKNSTHNLPQSAVVALLVCVPLAVLCLLSVATFIVCVSMVLLLRKCVRERRAYKKVEDESFIYGNKCSRRGGENDSTEDAVAEVFQDAFSSFYNSTGKHSSKSGELNRSYSVNSDTFMENWEARRELEAEASENENVPLLVNKQGSNHVSHGERLRQMDRERRKKEEAEFQKRKANIENLPTRQFRKRTEEERRAGGEFARQSSLGQWKETRQKLLEMGKEIKRKEKLPKRELPEGNTKRDEQRLLYKQPKKALPERNEGPDMDEDVDIENVYPTFNKD